MSAKETPQVDTQLTHHVAHLARLELSPAEAEKFTSQLSEILKYMETLQSKDLNLAEVEPLFQPFEAATAFRDDIVESFGLDAHGQPLTLSVAPDVVDGGFKVPQVL
jgi:aspartyl-tRNA(Asn)/glutamyl-tRNA(Gln) amidotransferase subunit C